MKNILIKDIENCFYLTNEDIEGNTLTAADSEYYKTILKLRVQEVLELKKERKS